jgi:hypothetical protein
MNNTANHPKREKEDCKSLKRVIDLGCVWESHKNYKL